MERKIGYYHLTQEGSEGLAALEEHRNKTVKGYCEVREKGKVVGKARERELARRLITGWKWQKTPKESL